ncbi:MAG: hypothetical protein K6T83_05270 [Alicyclobacillus sp.]|nr:hypothetical protein [Alicyclobacillus sp.]
MTEQRSFIDFEHNVLVRCHTGSITASLQFEAWSQWEVLQIEVSGEAIVHEVILRANYAISPDEVFITAPNIEDIRYAHPLQTVCLGYGLHHPHFRFGAQWMFTPPPLVFPLRIGHRWHGVAVAAEPGKNLYLSVTYRPVSRQAVELVITYDGTRLSAGDGCAVMVSRASYDEPQDVIRSYAVQLEEVGWVPSVKRDPVEWWLEPFVCTWGEQCNLYHKIHSPRKEQGQYGVTTYETQINQERWIQRLLDKGIPFGVVSTSDKWQLHRYRLQPDEGRYHDLRAFADWHHREGRHVIAWWGLWNHDGAPLDWCIRDTEGKPLSVDPENLEYRRVLVEDIERLLSPQGYDLDGFFLDFTAHQPRGTGIQKSGHRWGIELLHEYIRLIHDVAKSVKSDAMIMTHCPHPYFADVTDVLRLNDWSVRNPNVVEQARYRHSIATACSDWLINTDNWIMYNMDQWRQYLEVQPELGIPASWFTHGVLGEGTWQYEAFTEDDYSRWREIWSAYRQTKGLDKLSSSSVRIHV